MLYEIYDDETAFDFHLSTSRYKNFAAAIERHIEVTPFRRLGLLVGTGEEASWQSMRAGVAICIDRSIGHLAGVTIKATGRFITRSQRSHAWTRRPSDVDPRPGN